MALSFDLNAPRQRSALGRAVQDLGELRAAGPDEGDAAAGGHSLALQGLGDLAGAAVKIGERGQAAASARAIGAGLVAARLRMMSASE